jgi:hypothetical protein
LSSGLLDHGVKLVYFDISEELVASIFKGNEFDTVDSEMFGRQKCVII